MDCETILVEVENGVATITLNRPDKLNAMNRQMMQEVQRTLKALEADYAVGCVVFTGAGRAFSAGGDIHEQREHDRKYSQEELDRMRTYAPLYDIGTCTKPAIGMMNGLAYGGAAVFASSLDIRVGCEDTKFRFLAAAYGRINATWTLPNQIGWPIAKELLFTARIVEAEEAYRIGLLNHLVPREKLHDKAMELAGLIVGNHRGAVMGVKALLMKQKNLSVADQFAEERNYTTEVMRGAKAEEAFPEFIARKGRPLA